MAGTGAERSRTRTLGVLLALGAAAALVLALWRGVRPVDAPGDVAPERGGALEAPPRGARGLLPAPAAPAAPQASAAPADGGEARGAATRRAAAGEGEDARWLAGRVLFPAGTPQDERAFVIARSSARFEREVEGSDRERRAPVAADGRFRVACAPGARSARLWVEGRYLFQRERLRVDLREPPAELVLEPALGGRVEGRLVADDPRGFTPGELAGARVEAPWGADLDGLGPRRAPVAADGSFALDALPPSDAWALQGTLPQHVDPELHGLEVRAGEVAAVELAVQRGVRVAGRALRGDGAPAAGAQLKVATEGGPRGEEHRSEAGVLADAAGRFALDGLPPGELSVSVELADHLRLQEPLGARVSGEAVEDLELALDPGLAIEGSVTWPDGTPAAGARVALVEAQSFLSFGRPTTEADAEGRFRIGGLDAEPRVVHASLRAPDAAQQEDDGGRRLEAPIWSAERADVRPGAEPLALVLRAGAVARGRVVDDTGAPVERFRVSAAPESDFGPFSDKAVMQSFRSPDGSFELQGLDGLNAWVITATARGHLASRPAPFPPPGGGALRLVVRRPAELAGVVQDPAGAPVRGARVVLLAEDEDGALSEWADDGAEASSRADGTFRLPRAPGGRVALLARAEGFGASPPVELELAPGEQRGGLVLALRRPGTIAGEVHGHVGQVAGRSVRVSGDETWALLETDAAGRFEMGGLSPGVYEVVLLALAEEERDAADGGLPLLGGILDAREQRDDAARVELAAGQRAWVVLGAPPADPARVHGRVTLGGAPAPGELVRCAASHGEGRGVARTRTDAAGGYALVVDGPGEYVLSVGAADPVEFRVTVPPPGELAFDVALPGGRIAGVVVGPAGPAAGVEVWLQGGGSDAGAAELTREREVDPEGRFAFDRLPAGSYSLRAAPPARWAWQEPGPGEELDLASAVVHGVDLAEGQAREDLRLELVRGGRVRGVVRAPDGAPAAGATLWFEDEREVDLFPGAWFESDLAGRFESGPLQPGRVFVRAWTDATTSERVAVDVASGGTAEVELRLQPD